MSEGTEVSGVGEGKWGRKDRVFRVGKKERGPSEGTRSDPTSEEESQSGRGQLTTDVYDV